MPAYLIANIRVTDPEKFEQYRREVVPVLQKFGARHLVRGGAVETLEGPARLQRVVVLEFPDVATAHAFYASAEYAPLLALRLAAAESEVAIVQGYTP